MGRVVDTETGRGLVGATVWWPSWDRPEVSVVMGPI